MKKLVLSLSLLLTATILAAQNAESLIPRPRSINANSGMLRLQPQLTIATGCVSADIKAEAEHLARLFNRTEAARAKVRRKARGAQLKMELDPQLSAEEYKLSITPKGISVRASAAKGFAYAFRTLTALLPHELRAGLKAPDGMEIFLPCCEIADAPRFGYRGFMLDCSRHFFPVEDIKHVLDIMALYKMNAFHWHITDDHGWRIEIRKYPRLTQVGSIAPKAWMVDWEHPQGYWQEKPYGPFFYTQDEAREIVAYAAERHIEVIPEIDMPGHFRAALAAYPEFSCAPAERHEVCGEIGGVWTDVLNVGDERAVAFAKDILEEIIDIFPSETIHIGGDECPTWAWERNAACQEVFRNENMTSYHEMQSRFTEELGCFLRSKGRRLAVWNEAITAGGADTKKIQEAEATVYCWTPYTERAAAKATELGLKHIYTPQFHYYINQRQSPSPTEPSGAGHGQNNLPNLYKQSIPAENEKLLLGVQATFWTEHVSGRKLLEYLMLPRLLAVAEAGWTPQHLRTYEDFLQRVRTETGFFETAGLNYGHAYVLDNPDKISDEHFKAELPAGRYRIESAYSGFTGKRILGYDMANGRFCWMPDGKSGTETEIEIHKDKDDATRYVFLAPSAGKYLQGSGGMANTTLTGTNYRVGLRALGDGQYNLVCPNGTIMAYGYSEGESGTLVSNTQADSGKGSPSAWRFVRVGDNN